MYYDLLIHTLSRAARLPRRYKQFFVFTVDLLLLGVAILIAYSIRMGVWAVWNEAIWKFAIGAYAAMVPIFLFAGVYRTIFRFAGVGMMRTIARAFVLYGAVLTIIYMLIGFPPVPRTLAILHPLTYFTLLMGVRVAARYLMIDLLGRGKFAGEEKRVLIYGAGAAGQQLVNGLRSEPGMRICGFVDDDERLDGQKLDGYKVFKSSRLANVVERLNITDILLAIPSSSRKRRSEIVSGLKKLKVAVKVLPRPKDIIGGEVSVSDIRPVEIEDLLGREPVRANELLLGKTVVGKSVMVTGAGGSIGSELCRQISRIGPERLVLLEMSEFALYKIEQELRNLTKAAPKPFEIVPVLGNVLDRETVANAIGAHKIKTIFHAAAYKHVPLVESNIIEGARNNVLGTLHVAQEAVRAEIDDFILISTDKAVRPTNVMGATKRFAEQILQNLAKSQKQTRFSMVRFGNVLGSSGSVVPLFREQIEAGGPVTLTHRDVTRYFMTIPEAASLVIQAGGLASGGEVFVLDMGSPIKISKLARSMVELSGLEVRDADNPDGDIDIVEVGLRPGEKLFEELLIGASPQHTRHERIMMAMEDWLPEDQLWSLLDRLAEVKDATETLDIIKLAVPEFDHATHGRRIDRPSA